MSIPDSTFNPRPQPPMFPILKASPPNTINPDSRYPKPGNNSFAKSCARFSVTANMRQIFICAPISSNIEMMITKPKLDNSFSVNTVVCVRKPGPIADVAIKNAAPMMAELFTIFFTLYSLDGNVVF